jgi:hypothetical protein
MTSRGITFSVDTMTRSRCSEQLRYTDQLSYNDHLSTFSSGTISATPGMQPIVNSIRQLEDHLRFLYNRVKCPLEPTVFKAFFSFNVFGKPAVHFSYFSPLLPLIEVSLQPSAIPGCNPPGDWQSAVRWEDARFKPGTAGQQSGMLPLSHHASLEPPCLPQATTPLSLLWLTYKTALRFFYGSSQYCHGQLHTWFHDPLFSLAS